MTSLPPVIILGIDTPIGLTVIRELGARGVPVHGIGRTENALGRASRYCSSFSLRPAALQLAQWLPERIAATGAKALLAISETDLIALAELEPMIGQCRILTPRSAQLALVLDKTATLARARQLGIDVPESWLPGAEEDFQARAGKLEYPLVAKWPDPPSIAGLLEARGLALVKAEFIHNAADLMALLNRYAPLGRWPLIQQYCPGVGLGQMLYMDAGKAALRFQHRRLHEWPPEGGVSSFCRAEPGQHHQAQMARSEALLQAIEWQGPAMVEYRHDPATGRYWLMEINGRFWGSLPLAWHCGAHFAWESYRRAVLGETTPAPAPHGNLRARYMVPETRRLLRVLFNRRAISDPFFHNRPVGDLLSYVAGFADPRMRYYVFSMRDPGPFISDVKSMAGKLVRRGKP